MRYLVGGQRGKCIIVQKERASPLQVICFWAVSAAARDAPGFWASCRKETISVQNPKRKGNCVFWPRYLLELVFVFVFLFLFFLLFLLKTNKIPSLLTTSKGGGKRIIINGENRSLQRKNASHILMSKIKFPKSCILFWWRIKGIWITQIFLCCPVLHFLLKN